MAANYRAAMKRKASLGRLRNATMFRQNNQRQAIPKEAVGYCFIVFSFSDLMKSAMLSAAKTRMSVELWQRWLQAASS